MSPSPGQSLGVAVGTLTALPVSAAWPQDGRTDAPGYYPVVGILLGGVGALSAYLLVEAGALRVGSLAVAAAVVGVWAVATRLLHWDGLADVADAYLAPERADRLSIMRDSSIGAFGAFAVAFVLLLQVASLAGLVERGVWLAIAVVPAFARLSATFGAWFGRPARPDGLGASVVGRPRIGAVIPALVACAVCTVGLVAQDVGFGSLIAGVGVLLAAGVPHLLARRFGGVTGDVLGASVLVTETVLLFACAWAW